MIHNGIKDQQLQGLRLLLIQGLKISDGPQTIMDEMYWSIR